MFRRLSLLVVTLLWVLTATAQNLSNTEFDYLDEINRALQTTLELESFSIAGEQSISQDITTAGILVKQDIVQVIEADYMQSDDGYNAYFVLDQVLEQEASGMDVEIGFVQELLLIDDGLYIRFSDVEPDEINDLYPQEWQLFSEAATEYMGLMALNAQTFEQMMDAQQATAPYVELTEAMTEVQLLDSEEIDGQSMDVYQTTLDPALMFSQEVLDEAMSLFDFSAFGIPADSFNIEVEEGAEIEYNLHIGQEDGYIHRIDSIITMTAIVDGTPLGVEGDIIIEQDLEQSFDYFNFNQVQKLPTP